MQQIREKLRSDHIAISAPPDVLDAIDQGKPYDKSKVKAINPLDQNEVDKMLNVNIGDKIRRKFGL